MPSDSLISLSARLTKARAARDELECLTAKHQETKSEIQRLFERSALLAIRLEKEEQDVVRLEKGSLSNLLRNLNGNKQARLAREKAEAVAAGLAYQAAKTELCIAKERSVTLERLLAPLARAKEEYALLVEEMTQWLVAQGGQKSVEVLSCAEKSYRLESTVHQLTEAIDAAQEAEHLMDRMLGYLREAETSWFDTALALLDEHECSKKEAALGNASVDAVDARQALARLDSALRSLDLSKLQVSYSNNESLFERARDSLVHAALGSSAASAGKQLAVSVQCVESTTVQVRNIRVLLCSQQQSSQSELQEAQLRFASLLEQS